MEPNTPRRPDGASVISTGQALTATAWEVVNGEVAYAPPYARGRFYRCVWKPYRRWFFALLVGLILIGAATGWALQRYTAPDEGTYAGTIAAFVFLCAILACVIWPIAVVTAYWIRFWRLLNRRQRILVCTVIGAIPIVVHFWWLLLLTFGPNPAKNDPGWAGWKTLAVWEMAEHKRNRR